MVYNNELDDLATAFESAVSQDYPNLEIVISDDHSTDATYAILEGLIENYGGPHDIILTRNPRNLGIVGNFNTAYEKTSGDFIVHMNGDDVARPDRVSKLVRVWQSEPDVMLVSSPARYVTAEGEVVGMQNLNAQAAYEKPLWEVIINHAVEMGSCNGYDRAVFREFGPVPEYSNVEDTIMTIRAKYLGKIRKCDEALVDVRPGGFSWKGPTDGESRNHSAFTWSWKAALARSTFEDFRGKSYPGKWRVELYNRAFLIKEPLRDTALAGISRRVFGPDLLNRIGRALKR